jgi:hypothetical protein
LSKFESANLSKDSSFNARGFAAFSDALMSKPLSWAAGTGAIAGAFAIAVLTTEGFSSLRQDRLEAQAQKAIHSVQFTSDRHQPANKLKAGQFSLAVLENIQYVDDGSGNLELRLNTLDKPNEPQASSRIEVTQHQDEGFLMAGWPVLVTPDVTAKGGLRVTYIDRRIMQSINEHAKAHGASSNIRNIVCNSPALSTLDWAADLQCYDHVTLKKHGFQVGMK